MAVTCARFALAVALPDLSCPFWPPNMDGFEFAPPPFFRLYDWTAVEAMARCVWKRDGEARGMGHVQLHRGGPR